MTHINPTRSIRMLNYYRSTSTGAFSTLFMFALCWAGVALGLPLVLTHGFVSLLDRKSVV